jgi:hypothetical protein
VAQSQRRPCPATICDAHVTITCELRSRHHGDHLRGWLTWDDDGVWGARRYWPHGKPGSLPVAPAPGPVTHPEAGDAPHGTSR